MVSRARCFPQVHSRRPDRGLNRRPDRRQREGFASVFRNRLGYGCPPTIFWDNLRGLNHLSENSRAGWKRQGQALRCDHDRRDGESPMPVMDRDDRSERAKQCGRNIQKNR
jgi:hypothetical protein